MFSPGKCPCGAADWQTQERERDIACIYTILYVYVHILTCIPILAHTHYFISSGKLRYIDPENNILFFRNKSANPYLAGSMLIYWRVYVHTHIYIYKYIYTYLYT